MLKMKIILDKGDVIITDDFATTDMYVTNDNMVKILKNSDLRRKICAEFKKPVIIENMGEEIKSEVFSNKVSFDNDEIIDSEEESEFGFC